MRIRITKTTNAMAIKYPRVETTDCGSTKETPLPKEGEDLARSIEDALVNWTLTALKQVGMPEKIKNLEVQVIQEVKSVLKEIYDDQARNTTKNN